jgi:hypothetical protein
MLTVKKATLTITSLFVVAFLTVSLVVANSGAQSGFTGSINNPTNSFGSGTLFLKAAREGTTQCTSEPSSNKIDDTDSFVCSSDQFPSVPTAALGTSNVDLSNPGTMGAISSTYKARSCGPVSVADNRNAANPMLSRGSTSFNQPGPDKLSYSNNSIRLNGNNASSLININPTAPLQNFSLSMWFKTDTASGALFSWSPAASDKISGLYDRSVYFTSNGSLAFSTFSGSARTITSSGVNYANNGWHHVVATAQSNVTTSTSQTTLYVDGAVVASATHDTPTVARATANGYWHVGQGNITTADGFSGSGTTFKGSVSNFAVQPSVYTAANVTNLYSATTFNTYSSRVLAFGPQSYWYFTDTGTVTYAGPYPVIGASNPCTHVNISVGTTTSCIFPYNGAAPCGALSKNVSELAAAAAVPMVSPAPGSTQRITVQIQRNDNYNSDFDTGLKLSVPIVITQKGFQNTTFTWRGNVTVI